MSRLLSLARKHRTQTIAALSYSAVSGSAVGSALLICRVLGATCGVR